MMWWQITLEMLKTTLMSWVRCIAALLVSPEMCDRVPDALHAFHCCTAAGQYYGLPLLSIRAAAYHLMVKKVPGYQGE